MRLSRKFRAFRRLSGRDRFLLFEAAFFLAVARAAVLTVPFRYIAPWLKRAPATQSGDADLPHAVRRAIATAAAHVPWNAVCLPQAIAAKAMLARRGCGSAFHLGATFDADGKLIAHAWLVAGGRIVTGEKGLAGMAELARFG